MAELDFKSAFELMALIRRREVKPSEAVGHALARVETLNPRLNAFVAMRAEQAMAEARALDERLARREELGLLAGVPLAVKDLEEVAGMPTTFGSRPFRDNLAAEDAIEVARLRAAGAIVIGKTNTPEFGHSAFTRNLLFGVTRNPWKLERTPGGSSGGSAAAVASGMVPMATASDAGGSIRLPAAYTGCVGLKPSHGRIPAGPRLGMESFNGISSVGPITRTVTDAALYLDAACGYHPADSESLPHPGISYLGVIERMPKRLRVAFHPDFGHAIERGVLRAAEEAARAFGELGCTVETINEAVPETALAWTTVRAAQLLAQLADVIPAHRADMNRSFVAYTEAAANTGWREYGAAQRTRAEFNEWARRLFERYDLLLTPATATAPFAANGPPPSEIEGQRLADPLLALVFTYPFNLSGHPAIALPAGMTDDGLPCGIQIAAERHRDDLVLQAAYAYERLRPWNHRPPQI
ncbi:MAG TPA: amidase [Candidatus Binataceae bacterium]|nr:amidase [Candidatus Binataceae bacterium]